MDDYIVDFFVNIDVYEHNDNVIDLIQYVHININVYEHIILDFNVDKLHHDFSVAIWPYRTNPTQWQ